MYPEEMTINRGQQMLTLEQSIQTDKVRKAVLSEQVSKELGQRKLGKVDNSILGRWKNESLPWQFPGDKIIYRPEA